MQFGLCMSQSMGDLMEGFITFFNNAQLDNVAAHPTHLQGSGRKALNNSLGSVLIEKMVLITGGGGC